MEHHQLLVYADDVNLLGKTINIITSTEALSDTIKEVGPEVNAEKTKYTFTSCNQITEQKHYIMVARKAFENVENFKCLETMLTNQNCIHEEIQSRLHSENACYHAVQNLLSSHLLPKNVKIKIYKTIILPAVL
jgi:hypothetical protein